MTDFDAGCNFRQERSHRYWDAAPVAGGSEPLAGPRPPLSETGGSYPKLRAEWAFDAVDRQSPDGSQLPAGVGPRLSDAALGRRAATHLPRLGPMTAASDNGGLLSEVASGTVSGAVDPPFLRESQLPIRDIMLSNGMKKDGGSAKGSPAGVGGEAADYRGAARNASTSRWKTNSGSTFPSGVSKL